MANGGGISLSLSLRRSGQSGDKISVVGGGWQNIFIDSDSSAYLFGGAVIDLSSMLAPDAVQVRVLKKITQTGNYIQHDLQSYTDIQPTNHKAIRIGPVPDIYGILIQLQQTAGLAHAYACEFMTAKL